LKGVSVEALCELTFTICGLREFRILEQRALCLPPNKQLQRTVIRRRERGASAPFHYALAPRWIAWRAAAELRL
jgi:hypothetical protein